MCRQRCTPPASTGSTTATCDPLASLVCRGNGHRFVFLATDGTELNRHGSADARFRLQQQDIGIRFGVTDVEQPMLSVVAAVDTGKCVIFSHDGSYIQESGPGG